MGKPLSKWILKKLEIIAQHLGEYQVKNGYELSNKISFRMNHNHILVTFHYDNIFTNINFGKTKSIIREKKGERI